MATSLKIGWARAHRHEQDLKDVSAHERTEDRRRDDVHQETGDRRIVRLGHVRRHRLLIQRLGVDAHPRARLDQMADQHAHDQGQRAAAGETAHRSHE
ncbi:hypothetical protein G6F21_014590 [Rhizopus arrhizus]|nr:hypothetical protein G6F21_014590 [Rhizopus arrhizus]